MTEFAGAFMNKKHWKFEKKKKRKKKNKQTENWLLIAQLIIQACLTWTKTQPPFSAHLRWSINLINKAALLIGSQCCEDGNEADIRLVLIKEVT